MPIIEEITELQVSLMQLRHSSTFHCSAFMRSFLCSECYSYIHSYKGSPMIDEITELQVSLMQLRHSVHFSAALLRVPLYVLNDILTIIHTRGVPYHRRDYRVTG